MTTQAKRATIAALGAALATTAIIAVPGKAQDPAAPTVLEFVSRDSDTRSSFVDAPPRRREGPGDLFTIEGRLRGGAGRVVATFTQTSRVRAHGAGTLMLAQGKIVFAGVLNASSRVNDFAVVGGTGAYANARGTMTGTESRTAMTFRVTLTG